MTDQKFKEVFSWTHIVQVLLIIIGSLIAVTFYGIKERVDLIGSDVIQIRLDVREVKSDIKYHGDAINGLDRKYDYLEKTKVDK